MAINDRLRFEILRRDAFACRYCGSKAPDVALEVDHVIPQALGGTDSPENLVAACGPCNSGKGSTSLDAETVAEIDAEAARFKSAMGRAQQIMEERDSEAGERALAFLEHWEKVMPSFAQLGRGDLPSGPSVSKKLSDLMAAGLAWDRIIDAVEIAADASHVPQRRRYSYFCGICARMLDELRDLAAEMARERPS